MDKFSRTLHGYNPDEVNKFLDDIILEVENMIESNHQKNEQIILLKSELAKFDDMNEIYTKAKKYDELQLTLNNAIINAEDTSERIIKAASKKRDLIIEEANENARIIINDAIKKSEMIERDASILKNNIIMFKKKLISNLNDQIRISKRINDEDV